jgi:hypothetical protein
MMMRGVKMVSVLLGLRGGGGTLHGKYRVYLIDSGFFVSQVLVS